MFTETSTGVSPATVLQIDGPRLLLQMPQRQAWASMALAFPFSPEVGDLLLAIGDEDVYVIGVLEGRGKTTFTAPGDLAIRAQGQVEISGGRGVKLAGPKVEVQADRLELVAREAFERFVDVYRWAKGVVQNSASRMRTLVTGPYTVQAEHIFEQAQREVKIDGSHINIG